MRILITTIYLSCLMMSLVNGGSESKQYCYDPPGLSCAEEHILDCPEGQVITTDTASFHVSYFKNNEGSFPECQTENDECKNKTTCCTYISRDVTKEASKLTADDNTKLIIFIKTECSFKSSCIVSSYRTGSSKLYDYINYTYSCIPASKDNITVDFLVNGSTKFTGNRFPTVYYLDYTGNGTKDNDVILNRECLITTTKRDITFTIKILNLQADDCCRFHISGYIIPEYCSENGSSTPPKGKSIGENTATIRLQNVVNKDGDSFSILVKAAGNVTIDCRDCIEQVDTQEPTTCQYPTPESSTISSNSSTVVSSTNTLRTSPPKTAKIKKEDSETNLAGIIGGTVGGLVVLVVIIIVVVVIMRRRRRQKNKVDENNYYSTVDDNPKDKLEDYPKASSNYSYIDIDLDKVAYKTIPNNSTNQVKSSSGKDKDPKDVNKKNPIFVEGKFGENKESKDDKKRSVPKEKSNAQKKVEAEADNYTYIDNSMIKPLDKPSVSADKDSGQRNAKKELPAAQYTKVNKKQGKFIPTKDKAVNLDNYNHVGLKEGPPRIQGQDQDNYNHIGLKEGPPSIQEQDQDNYNHIDFNFKKDNSLPKGSNSKPSSNYNYAEIDLPQEDERDDTYDHAQQEGEKILNQKDKKEQNASDTYNHIGTKNDSHVAKGVTAVSDTYNHIGVNNNNSVSKGDNSDLDTYNHIEVNNFVAKGANSDLDTYNHIGGNNENSVTNGTSSDSDTYNHIGANNENSVTKGVGSDSDTYNHIGGNNENSVFKGDNSYQDTYNHIGANNDNSVPKRAKASNLNQASDNYSHVNL